MNLVHKSSFIVKKRGKFIEKLFVAQSAVHLVPGRPVHTNTISTSVEASSHAGIAARKLFALIISSLSIARYSFIQLGELRQSGANKTSLKNGGKLTWNTNIWLTKEIKKSTIACPVFNLLGKQMSGEQVLHLWT